jgi:LysR family hydrogen peroxide-inducible transcriptional activator
MRYAQSVADRGSFRLAAAACNVSQPGLSMQMQKLEEMLGVVLFDRSKKPVLMTDEGQRVIDQIRTVLRETQRLGQIVLEQEEPAGKFRLAVIPSLSSTIIPLFLGDFVQRYPRVELLIEELQTDEMIQRLQADAVDAGIAATPLDVPGIVEKELGRERMYAYLSPGDPLLRRKSVTQSALRDRALWVMPEGHCFRSQVLSYCGVDRTSKHTPIQFESGNFQTLVHLVDEGLAATVLPALVADTLPDKRRRAQLRPLVSPVPVREIGLVTARVDLRRKVSAALAESIRSALSRKLGKSPGTAVVLDPVPE